MAIEPSFAQSQQIDALPVPNLPLLRKVLDHIDAHPEEWEQSNFAPLVGGCGTTYCIAGHAVAMTTGVRRVAHPVAGGYAVEPADGTGDWEGAGRRALGLTQAEASDMFYGSLSPEFYGVETRREAVQVISERIAARAGERL